MSVNDGYVIEMFALRWLILYQHAFLKKGYEEITELFRTMEGMDFSRNRELGEQYMYLTSFVVPVRLIIQLSYIKQVTLILKI